MTGKELHIPIGCESGKRNVAEIHEFAHGVIIVIQKNNTMAAGKMSTSKELMQMDLYGLLGVDAEASEKEIKKAYRQKALTCHPDKNPDNPRAAELFHQLSQALEVLTDGAARAAYDQLRKAKEAAAKRTQKLDAKRKKVKLDLEAREKEAQTRVTEEEEAHVARMLEKEIIRLREEGSRQLEEQQRLVWEQVKLEKVQKTQGNRNGNTETGGPAKLKLKWKCKKDDETRGGYTEDFLQRLLQKKLWLCRIHVPHMVDLSHIRRSLKRNCVEQEERIGDRRICYF
ncbi:dnaJ homolog subfamily C member 17 isoform X3 [Rhinoderma darwinii]|uniref:dnaJ homolog subfamily C member 17 isoform X3 n=1 Tax=Rhinoderma darwinii TaxID=43563 RepID=UPI003F67FE5D